MGDLLLLRPVATTIRVTPEALASLEFHDAEVVDDQLERIHVSLGQFELVLEGPDLLALADRLRAELLDAEEALMDVRQEDAATKRQPCWCGSLIDPDEPDCGQASCRHLSMQDRKGLIP